MFRAILRSVRTTAGVCATVFNGRVLVTDLRSVCAFCPGLFVAAAALLFRERGLGLESSGTLGLC